MFQLPGPELVGSIAIVAVEGEVFVRTNVAPMATAVGMGSMIVLVQHSKLL